MALHQFQAKQLDGFATSSTVCMQQPTTQHDWTVIFLRQFEMKSNWNPNNDTANSLLEAATATVDDITELHHKLSKKIRQQEESTAQ